VVVEAGSKTTATMDEAAPDRGEVAVGEEGGSAMVPDWREPYGYQAGVRFLFPFVGEEAGCMNFG
jgi:hypothetical protein